MSYKTILVHFCDERQLPGLLRPAIDLARRFGAHLIGLAVLPPPIFEPALVPGGGSVVVDSHRKAFAAEAERMRQAFDVATREGGLSAEWVNDDAGAWPVWRKVAGYARATDLIVVAQQNRDLPLSGVLEADEELPMQTGRPVLYIPNKGDHVGAGKRILVAWNGRREASRAAFDALPLLKRAEMVRALWINPEGPGGAAQDLPAADLCTALARHKVKCDAAEGVAPDAGAGEALLAAAEGLRADLLVMGCYGHSRLRELVLGGATRYVLQHMTIPVLMAH